MAFWEQNVDQFITSNDFPLLTHAGSISHEQMEARTGGFTSGSIKTVKGRKSSPQISRTRWI